MIVTLTPNPSVDRTLHVEQIRFNEVLRTNTVRVDWGGKGFNVSKALRILGEESIALAWVGGGAGTMLQDGLNRLGIQTDFIWVDEETRINTVAQEEAGEWYIRLNEPGPHIPERAVKALLEKADFYANDRDVWVASGSLPQDVPDDFYAQLIRLLRAKGVRVLLDANDLALKKGVEAAPFLVRPDQMELENFVGYPIKNVEDAKRAALRFLNSGVQHAAISVGETNLLLSSQYEMVLANAPRLPEKKVTGVGDAVMSGLAYGFARKMTLVDIARWAVAFAAVVIKQEGLWKVSQEDVLAMLARVESRTLNVM